METHSAPGVPSAPPARISRWRARAVLLVVLAALAALMPVAPASAQDSEGTLTGGESAATALQASGLIGDVVQAVGDALIPAVQASPEDPGPNSASVLAFGLDEEGLLGGLGGLLGGLLGGPDFLSNLLAGGALEASAEVNQPAGYAESAVRVTDLAVLGALGGGLSADTIHSTVRLDCANPDADPFAGVEFVDLRLFDRGLIDTVTPNGPVLDFTLNLQNLSVEQLRELIQQVGNVADLIGGGALGELLGPTLATLVDLLDQILGLLGGVLDPVLDLLLNQLLGAITSQLPDVIEVSVGLFQVDDNQDEFDTASNPHLEASVTALSLSASLLDINLLDLRLGEATAAVDCDFQQSPPTPECPPTASTLEGINRLAGEERIASAIAISQERWTDECVGQIDAVVLSRHDLFVDAMAGTPLAATRSAPILVTPTTDLVDPVAAEIQRLLPDGEGTVYLLGGVDALDENVEAAVADLGLDVVRIGGPTRYETAGLIAESLGEVDHIMVATGLNHSDALVAGAAAAHVNGAVVLTPGAAPHPVVDDLIASTPTAEVHAIGGQAAEAYPDVEPIAGETRAGTAVAVAEAFFDNPTHVGIARGDDFPDAMAGGAHIGGYGGPLLLTDTATLSPETAAYVESIDVQGIYIYGGNAAVSAEVEAALQALLVPAA